MEANIENYIARTASMEWKSLIEDGIDTKDIFIKVLRFNEQQQRPCAIILKFEPGAGYPFHNHPAGEEIFVIKGSCLVNDTILSAGDYLYTPPGFKHAVKTEKGCEMILIVPEEVEILER